MKNISFTILLLLTGYFTNAQLALPASTSVPQKFAYSSQVRDASGELLINQFINLQFTLHDGGPNGPVVYVETDTATTSPSGIFTVVIGGGSVVQGNFDSIPWQRGNIYLQIEMDATGGTNFSTMGVSQLLSFPYALSAGNGIASINYDSIGRISIRSTDNKTTTSNGSSWLTTGNTGTAPNGFIGTTDNTDLILKRMGAEGLRLRADKVVTTTGKLGVGVADPATSLDISGGLTLRDNTVNVNGNFTLTVGDRGLIFLNSSVSPYQAIATLANGTVKGQIIVLVVTGSATSKGVRFVNNGTINNTRINTDGGGVNAYSGNNSINLTEGNSLTLVWTGTDWVQIACTITKD